MKPLTTLFMTLILGLPALAKQMPHITYEVGGQVYEYQEYHRQIFYKQFARNFKALGSSCDAHLEALGDQVIISWVRLPWGAYTDTYGVPNCAHQFNAKCGGETEVLNCKGPKCRAPGITLDLLEDGNILYQAPGQVQKLIQSQHGGYYWCPKNR
jgi:hypothetical protein